MSILVLTSDTLSSPAAAGQIEYSSPIYAATPIGTQRGIVPTQQYYRLDTGRLVASTASAVSIFGVGATLSASTVYEFELNFAMAKTDGTTSHTMGIGFGGTATVNNIEWQIINKYDTVALTIATGAAYSMGSATSASNTTVTGATGVNTTIYLAAQIKGTVSINAGGTFIPQYTCSAAPGGSGYTTVAGSYIRINPLSASGAATNVGTWS
jgi:hypothetical protein